MKKRLLPLIVLAWLSAALPARAADWLHWRGPEQTGVSRDTGLPETWSPAKPGENNLIWKQPYGGRSTPVVSRGRVYIINSAGEGIREQERVMCFDAKTGTVLWEYRFNVFLTDIVTNRVGWANLAADPETGNVYAHGTSGLFFCFDPDGKVLWSKSMTEEYGRITGYGGRVGSPIVDEDLVIFNMLNASWGDQARGGHRFLAMNKKTGEVVWWSEPGERPLDTLYSVPVVAVINGQRLLIIGGGDGGVHALKVRTGEKVWSYHFSKRAINTSPVVDGHLVYVTHGEDNLDSTTMGGVLCLDAGAVTDGRPKLVWRQLGILAGYASPIIHNGRLYVPDNGANLHCLDAKTGKPLWKHSYGTVAKGSPVWGDGKIYVGEVNARFAILQPGDTECKTLSLVDFPPGPRGEVFEFNGSPAIADGRVYFTSGDAIYCLGTPNGKPGTVPPPPKEPPATPDAKPAHLQIVPADVAVNIPASISFKVRTFDADGRFLKELNPSEVEWSLPAPKPPPTKPGAKPPPPPPLKATITKDGKVDLDNTVPAQHGYVEAKLGELTARARVRVAPKIPVTEDFEKVPEGGVPAGWINLSGKFVVVTQDGQKVLKKLADNPNPLLARAAAYIGLPTMRDYTIEADLMGSLKKRGLVEYMPDMGVINCRYSLVLDGSKQRLLLRTWEANRLTDPDIGGRVAKKLDFSWKPGVWYRIKFRVAVEGNKAILQGKVWPRDEQEPENWTIQAEDPVPNVEGSPALYAYATGITAASAGAEIFYDNVKVIPNKAK
jgi:outer membrane protein assembly factor BamB